VFVHGELWNATAASAIPEGARVRVRAVEGLRVVVEEAN
jgi:membrane-bound ClpP family serine protease